MSFALNAVTVVIAPQTAFFLGPQRGWELLLGCILSRLPSCRAGMAAELFTVAGLVAILLCVFLFSGVTPFPGFAALIPCGAAMAIVYAGGVAHCGRLLALPPVLFFGRISYALYLWHWPIIVFAHCWMTGNLTRADRLILFLVAVFVAGLSTWFIERPFRRNAGVLGRRALFATAAGLGLFFVLLGLVAISTHGLPQRFGSAALRYSRYGAFSGTPEMLRSFRAPECFVFPDSDTFRPDICLVPNPKRKNVFLWGDSLAAHFGSALYALAERDEFHLLQATKGNCPPLVGSTGDYTSACLAFDDRITAWLTAHRIDGVILSADWFRYSVVGRRPDALFAQLHETLAFFRERHIPVVLVGPIFRYTKPLPDILMWYAQSGYRADHAPANFLSPEVAPFDKRMKLTFGGLPGVTYVSLVESVCGSRACPYLAGDGNPLQFDSVHLTPEGSARNGQGAWKSDSNHPEGGWPLQKHEPLTPRVSRPRLRTAARKPRAGHDPANRSA